MMNEQWIIDHSIPNTRIVRLQSIRFSDGPVILAEQLFVSLAATMQEASQRTDVELDLADWNEVDSRHLAMLIHFHRRCQDLEYPLTISYPPRLLLEMATRLNIQGSFEFGASRSRNFGLLFEKEVTAT